MWENSHGASKFILAAAFGFLVVSCSGNILTELSNETSNEALYEEAKKEINDGDFPAAVAACEDMTAGATADRDVAYVCASAYSGRCGLNFLSLTSALATYVASLPTPANPLLEVLMQMNTGATATNVTDCVTATTLLQSIGVAADRSDDENMLMVLNNIQTLGALASFLADTDFDDVIDGGYNTCSDLDATNADYLAEAFWELKESASLTGSTDIGTLGTAVDTACTAQNGADATADFCSAVDPDSFDANQYRGARGLFREDSVDFGLGAEACGTNVACAVACP